MKINIISRKNGVGLSQDINIIEYYLKELGHQTSFYDFSEKVIYSAIKADINIFLEIINIRWISNARENWIIPNQEWFEPHWKNVLLRFNKILCKTQCALNTFRTINKRVKYIGFTSEDKYLPEIQKDFNQFLHVAGKSGTKQTNLVWETWAKNPQLPPITIIQDKTKYIERPNHSNITYIYDRLNDNELKEIQNRIGYHICPSEAEGFGHYIMEGLSCGAVVLTTNAAPMNELVNTEYGFLCEYDTTHKQNLGILYKSSEIKLLKSINDMINCPKETINIKSNKAREFYLSNKASFEKNFIGLFK